jgi:motility quorum-sensing regulator / GCU-specific mRNA interferase toxin
MEKRRAHYDLETIKAEFSTVAGLRATKTARDCAFRLDLTLEDVVGIIASIERRHFYKSMTNQHDSRIWQDVYHVPAAGLVLYVKFTVDDEGHLLISFKEK